MSSEIERTFVLSDPPPGLRSHPHKRVEQGYVAVGEDGVEVRVRRSDGECTLTIKSPPGLMTAEVEFGSEEASDAFVPGDERYDNRSLAVHGTPG